MNPYSYYLAPFYGLYFYAIFQMMFFLRFGTFNTTVHILDLALLLIGAASVALCMYYSNKLPQRKNALIFPFLITTPFAYVGALGGGLLGFPGALILGTLPFLIILPLSYSIISKRTTNKSTDA